MGTVGTRKSPKGEIPMGNYDNLMFSFWKMKQASVDPDACFRHRTPFWLGFDPMYFAFAPEVDDVTQ